MSDDIANQARSKNGAWISFYVLVVLLAIYVGGYLHVRRGLIYYDPALDETQDFIHESYVNMIAIKIYVPIAAVRREKWGVMYFGPRGGEVLEQRKIPLF